MRFVSLSALLLAGALLTHCRHGAVDAGVSKTLEAGSASPELLDVPALADLQESRLDQLRVSDNGELLFTRWEVAEGDFDYRVVHLPTGKLIWSWRGILKVDRWRLSFSPDGSAGIVFLPIGLETPFIIFRVSGEPIPMTDIEFSGGAWANGGGWFGGPLGAYNADGSVRGKMVPNGLKTEEDMYVAGTRPDTLRYMYAGSVFEWSGNAPPIELGPWKCSDDVVRHWLWAPEKRRRVSPDGRFIAWTVTSSDALTVCDGESGEEFEVAPNSTPAAWVNNRVLWRLDAGALVGLDVLTREETQRITLPGGEKAVALDASTQPPALFIGTEQGRLLRIPLEQ